jgi:hypothetical protein
MINSTELRIGNFVAVAKELTSFEDKVKNKILKYLS